jgi:NADP-reducing hydrogenase subunit HndC
MKKLKSPTELDKYRQQLVSQRDPNRACIVTSVGTCGLARSAGEVAEAISKTLTKLGLKDSVDLRTTGCHGFCEIEPVVIIYPKGIMYQHVTPADVPEIISESVVNGKIIERLLYTDASTGKKITYEQDVSFSSKQNRVLLNSNKLVNPNEIDDYIAIGGYSALSKVLSSIQPDDVIETVKKSGLRGRGGAGFPTGRKWEQCRNAPSADGVRFVICNADEGDPGAYMNRSLLEGNPHSVLEGMIIGAYAIGSHYGYIYVRQEYPLAVQNVLKAIEQARGQGLLGENILGSGFNFDIKVHRGAGAFVSGESSALMTAIEGKVGEPRPKYIRTSISGVEGKPSTLNNVETWANVPLIINKGVDWFRSIGSEGSKGTKIFALVGKVHNSGLVEVPMGTTLREIIFSIGGGIPRGKKFKAVQTGGPSGGCIPERMLDMPVDFDELAKVGSMMGSGGMIVMDEDTCMVDIARYFVNFLSDESCGKCVPCREGLRQMLIILGDICSGKGTEKGLALLQEVAEVMKDASLCALGTSAANPVLSTIKYFRDEYESHIKEKRCPAGVCKKLVSYYIDPEKCQACFICARNCPVEAVSGGKGIVHVIDQMKCTKCGACFEVCPSKFGAVIKVSGKPVPASVASGTKVHGKER